MEMGKFITVEGIEGVGKSTNVAHLTKAIEARGHTVISTREPGGTPLAERIREMLIEHGDEPISDVAELLLMFASRSLHINNVILPALEAGTWVVCDRFVDASRAYQGGGRGLPMQDIDQIAALVLGDLKPDVTILLDAPVEIGMSRADKRGAPDRIETERTAFFERVRECYLSLAASDPERFVVVDATEDMATVRDNIESIVAAIATNKLD
ncbi:MAG: dTMP kinase [Desulfobulbaceae bacterium]|nr:dTMP kinase [Desulfobulbaceae bacterium]